MMYKLTLILFAFFSLVFSILAVPIRVPNEIDGPAQQNTTDAGTSYAGRVRAFIPSLLKILIFRLAGNLLLSWPRCLWEY